MTIPEGPKLNDKSPLRDDSTYYNDVGVNKTTSAPNFLLDEMICHKCLVKSGDTVAYPAKQQLRHSLFSSEVTKLFT